MELSDQIFYEKNFQLLRNTLEDNGYPPLFVTKTLREILSKLNQPVQEREPIDKKNICVLPYTRGLYEKIKPSLNKSNITAVARGSNTLNTSLFSKLKTDKPKMLQSNLVYEISCECRKRYVGQTVRRSSARLYDHQYNSRQGNIHHSALRQHLVETGHSANWEETKVHGTAIGVDQISMK